LPMRRLIGLGLCDAMHRESLSPLEPLDIACALI
jgi:hypothetical protein